MSGGWIKLYRELLDKPIWQLSTPEQKVVLITILLMANHQDKEWEWMGEKYILKPGQLITSLSSIASNCGNGISAQNIRTALSRFEKYDFLTNESTKQNRLITVENWGLYQALADEANKASNKRLTKGSQTVNKGLTINKNIKNIKNDKNDKNIIYNNIYNNTLRSTPDNKLTFHQQVEEEWNSLPDPISKISSINSGTKRFNCLKARVSEHGENEVLRAIKNIKSSSFLQGRNDNGWIISFDWFVKPNNFLKVLEGNYKDLEKTNFKQANNSSNPPKPRKGRYRGKREIDSDSLMDEAKKKQVELIRRMQEEND